MRELALVLPGDVWLTNLTGTDTSGGAPADSVRRRACAPRSRGPALELVGCAERARTPSPASSRR